MAYGKHYQLNWNSRFNGGFLYIYEKDYVGAVDTSLRLTRNGIVLSRDFEGWDEPIIGMTCEFEIVNEKEDYFELLDLMIATERKYKIIVEKATVPSPVTIFEGFVNTELVQQKYLHKQTIKLVASSYLSKLENTSPASIEILKNMTFIDIISEILVSTGSTQPVYILSTMCPTEDNLASGQTLFNKTGMYTEVFWTNNVDRKNSLEILTSILKTFNCYLYWWNTHWYIEEYCCLWDESKEYVIYDTSQTYSPSQAGTVIVASETFTIRDVHTLKFSEMSQKLGVNPGDKLLQIRFDTIEFNNMSINDFTDATQTSDAFSVPDLRRWLTRYDVNVVYYIGYNPATGLYTVNPGYDKIAYSTIENTVIETVSDQIHVYFFHKHLGLYTQFKMTYKANTSIDIKWKYSPLTTSASFTFTRHGNPVAFTGKFSDYNFHFNWYIYCVETGYAITKNTNPDIAKNYTVNYIGTQTEEDILNIQEVDGSSFDIGTKVVDVNVSIDLTNDVDLWSYTHNEDTDYHFVLCIGMVGVDAKEGGGATEGTAAVSYIGDIFITMTGGEEEANVIEGITNTDFINKRTIELDVADCINWNYKNVVLRGDDLLSRTALWDSSDNTSSGDTGPYSLIDWILYYKFRIYNVSRQIITSNVVTGDMLRPFSLFTEQKQADKKFILTGFRHSPIDAEYEVQLDEYDNETEINLMLP